MHVNACECMRMHVRVLALLSKFIDQVFRSRIVFPFPRGAENLRRTPSNNIRQDSIGLKLCSICAVTTIDHR